MNRKTKRPVRRFSVTGQVGGAGTYWAGFTYPLGGVAVFLDG